MGEREKVRWSRWRTLKMFFNDFSIRILILFSLLNHPKPAAAGSERDVAELHKRVSATRNRLKNNFNFSTGPRAQIPRCWLTGWSTVSQEERKGWKNQIIISNGWNGTVVYRQKYNKNTTITQQHHSRCPSVRFILTTWEKRDSTNRGNLKFLLFASSSSSREIERKGWILWLMTAAWEPIEICFHFQLFPLGLMWERSQCLYS